MAKKIKSTIQFNDLRDEQVRILQSLSIDPIVLANKVSSHSIYEEVIRGYPNATAEQFSLLARALTANTDPDYIRSQLFHLDTSFSGSTNVCYLYFGLNNNKLVLYADNVWTVTQRHKKIKITDPIWGKIRGLIKGKQVVVWDRRVSSYIPIKNAIVLSEKFPFKHLFEAAKDKDILIPVGHSGSNMCYYVWFMAQLHQLQPSIATGTAALPTPKKLKSSKKKNANLQKLIKRNGFSCITVSTAKVLAVQQQLDQWYQDNHTQGDKFRKVWEAFELDATQPFSTYLPILTFFQTCKHRDFYDLLHFYKCFQIPLKLPTPRRIDRDMPAILERYRHLRRCMTVLSVPHAKPKDYLPHIDLTLNYLSLSEEEILTQFRLKQLPLKFTKKIHMGIKFFDLEFTSDGRMREICLLDQKHIYINELHFDKATPERRQAILGLLAQHLRGSVLIGCGTDQDTFCLQKEYKQLRLPIPAGLAHRGNGRIVNIQGFYGLLNKENFVRSLKFLTERYKISTLLVSHWHLALQDTYGVLQVFSRLAPALLRRIGDTTLTPKNLLKLEQEFEEKTHPSPQAEFIW